MWLFWVGLSVYRLMRYQCTLICRILHISDMLFIQNTYIKFIRVISSSELMAIVEEKSRNLE